MQNPTSMKLLAKGSIDVERIITHRFTLDQVQEAIEQLEARADNVRESVVRVS